MTNGWEYTMVFERPLGLNSIGRMIHHLGACHTFHIHACMAAASERCMLDLVRIDLDKR